MSQPFKVRVNGEHDVTVNAPDETLLEAMENAGIETRYHCRDGFCGACRTSIKSGEVTYINEPLAVVRPNECLACCCTAASDLEIDH